MKKAASGNNGGMSVNGNPKISKMSKKSTKSGNVVGSDEVVGKSDIGIQQSIHNNPQFPATLEDPVLEKPKKLRTVMSASSKPPTTERIRKKRVEHDSDSDFIPVDYDSPENDEDDLGMSSPTQLGKEGDNPSQTAQEADNGLVDDESKMMDGIFGQNESSLEGIIPDTTKKNLEVPKPYKPEKKDSSSRKPKENQENGLPRNNP